MITYRKATPEDVRPALDLALRVFMEYDAPDYGPEHADRMRLAIDDRITNPDIYLSGKRLMFVALDDKKVIGIIETYGNNRIALLFVDGNYQRQGIATELMSRIICELKMNGFDKIVLNSSPHGLPFYKHFGFIPIETEKNINTPWKTPMEYIPNEIWDVVDEHGNKTGRYAERGRKMAIGDFHLVVRAWVINNKGEILITRRAMTKEDAPGLWEVPGGSAISGESSIEAVIREVNEECGFSLNIDKAELFGTRRGDEDFIDHWLFYQDYDVNSITLKETETTEARAATVQMIKGFIKNNDFNCIKGFKILQEWEAAK